MIDPKVKDFVSVEYAYAEFMNNYLYKNWKFVGQTLLKHNGKMIDKLQYEVEELDWNYWNYYFEVGSISCLSPTLDN